MLIAVKRGMFWIALAALVAPAAVSAQSRTAATDPGAWCERMEIGPVEGLTTVWHAAPHRTAVPKGATVVLRVRIPPSVEVAWSGSDEVWREETFALAKVRLDRLGLRRVGMKAFAAAGEIATETVELEPVDLGAQDIAWTKPRLAADEVVLDPHDWNASSMRYFFRPGSIARLSETSPGRYVTSTERWLTASVEVEPASLAPLVEWRVDGKPQTQLGATVRLQSFVAGDHRVEAGDRAVTLQAYRVHIVSHERRAQIQDGEPVTFSAVTSPPGYEQRITWLASTKYGTGSPAMGEGPEITVTFEGTTGTAGRWLGVRADSTTVSADSKGTVSVGPFECTGFDPASPEGGSGACIVNPVYECEALDPRADLPVDPGMVHCEVSNGGSYFCTCTAMPGSFPACDDFIAFCVFAGGEVSGDSSNASCGGNLDPEPPPFPPPPPPPPPPIP